MLFPNRTFQVALVSQLEPAVQRQFWEVARFAADHPNVSIKAPVDRIQSIIDSSNSSAGQAVTKSFGQEGEESNCKPAVDKVLPCIEVTAPSLYYSFFYQGWRSARPGDLFQAGTIFCQFGDNRSMCADYLRVHRENWEKEHYLIEKKKYRIKFLLARLLLF
jgi:hypothetical protein